MTARQLRSDHRRPRLGLTDPYRFVAPSRDPGMELARAVALVALAMVVILVVLPVLLGLATIPG